MDTPVATVAGLIEFINSQPADRWINNSRGWSRCAVGSYGVVVLDVDREYLRTQVVVPLWHDSKFTNDENVHIDFELHLSDKPCLMDMLNNSSFETYGEAQAWIAANPVE